MNNINLLARPSLARCVVVLVVATTTTAGVLALVGPGAVDGVRALRSGSLGSAGFDQALAQLCAGLAVPVAAWCWGVVTTTVLGLLGPASTRRRALAGRGFVRRVVLAACGVVLTGAGSLAHAAPGPSDPTTAVAASEVASRPGPGLDGLPMPDRPTGGPHPGHPVPDRGDAPPHVVVVRPGDSLWAVAVRCLPDGADATAVTRYWHRVHALNRSEIGPDPDLVVPGQRLHLPERNQR